MAAPCSAKVLRRERILKTPYGLVYELILLSNPDRSGLFLDERERATVYSRAEALLAPHRRIGYDIKDPRLIRSAVGKTNGIPEAARIRIYVIFYQKILKEIAELDSSFHLNRNSYKLIVYEQSMNIAGSI